MIDTLIKALRELKKYCSSEKFDINEFTLMLKEHEKKFCLTSNELLELLYNKDLLTRKVAYKTQAFDDEIKELKKRIFVLEEQKYQYGSLICELHGHNFEMTEDWNENTGRICFCTNCGKKIRLQGYEINKYLKEEEQSKSKIYKYIENN